jgi:hypothetical protein
MTGELVFDISAEIDDEFDDDTSVREFIDLVKNRIAEIPGAPEAEIRYEVKPYGRVHIVIEADERAINSAKTMIIRAKNSILSAEDKPWLKKASTGNATPSV